MKLRAIRLHNVKRFAGHGVAIENIGDGVNVLTAANEFGKSTFFDGLHALFFQPHSGTSSGVKMLRPYSGGSPLIEADIEAEEGRFRLTKQFLSGCNARVTDLATNRLVAQADEAESFISELTRGGAGGPAGLLWVRQGITGLDKRSRSEEESERHIRETLLSSVQGEVEALTGGRRMAEILSACEEALLRLVTPTGRVKSEGPYREALDELANLQALEQKLLGDVEALHTALKERRSISRRLAEIEAPEEVEARRREIEAAEEACQSARSHVETLRAAEANLALAAERHGTAEKALGKLDDSLARAEQLNRQFDIATQRLEAARARQSTALTESERLQGEAQDAEAAERQARETKNRFDAAQAARDAAERFEAAKDTLTQAEAIRTRIETGQARLASLQVPAKAIEQLSDFDLEMIRLRAAQATASPVLHMSYRDPSDASVSLAGSPLFHDTDKVFSGTVDLDIARIGRLTIRSHHIDNAEPAIAALTEKTRALLAGIGVDSLDAALRRQKAAQEQSDALALDRQLLDQLAPDGIEVLRETVTRLDELRRNALEIKLDATSVIAGLQAAQDRLDASRNAALEAKPAAELARDEYLAAHSALTELQAELRALDVDLPPRDQRESAKRTLAADLKILQDHLDEAKAKAEPLRVRSEDFDAAEITLTRLQSAAKATEQEIRRKKEGLAELNGQVRVRAEEAVEEKLTETRELLQAASARVHRYEIEVGTLTRLRDALTAARSSARDLYLKPVMTELRPLIGLLFEDITVSFNEDTLLPETVSRQGQQEDVDRLSGGMREQLSVLTRLAFARLLARDGHPAPVVLDDALVYSDDDRIERMFEALHRQSRDLQILVFSCRQRAFSRLGGNVLTMIDWTPA